jgi:DNA polymerase-3 subunit gamma/tau
VSYVVLARKYRPEDFGDMVGQEAVASTLEGAIAGGRLAHAYLFAGPRGVGKTSMARVLAKRLNCPNKTDGKPCNKCSVCQAIASGDDVDVIEIDGASHRKVEEIKPVIDNVRYTPSRSPYKVYIIDEVHMLSNHAFNSLLKTLEEPPPHVKFVFATTEPHRVPETIRSRCQRFDFRLLTVRDIERRLMQIAQNEGISPQGGLLARIARAARGSMRDSISLFDQVVSLAGTEPALAHFEQILGLTPAVSVRELMHAVAIGDVKEVLGRVNEILESGSDPAAFVGEVVDFLRDALVMKASENRELLYYGSAEDIGEAAQTYSLEDLMLMIAQLQEVRARLRRETDHRVILEMAFLRIARADQIRSLGQLADELADIRSSLAGQAVPAAVSQGQPAPSRLNPPKPPPPAARPEPKPPKIPLAEFSRRWHEVLDLVLRTGRSMWVKANFPMARLNRVSGSSVTLHVPPFVLSDAKGSFEEMDLRKKVKEALEEVSGEEVSVTLVADETLRPAPPAESDVQEDEGVSDEMVSETIRMVRKVFPGSAIEGK